MSGFAVDARRNPLRSPMRSRTGRRRAAGNGAARASRRPPKSRRHTLRGLRLLAPAGRRAQPAQSGDMPMAWWGPAPERASAPATRCGPSASLGLAPSGAPPWTRIVAPRENRANPPRPRAATPRLHFINCFILIEKAFSKLKAFLRKIAERTVAGLLRALETCAEIFKPSQCTNYLKSCGYEHDTGSAIPSFFRGPKCNWRLAF